MSRETDVLVVGGGVAGLSAGIFTARSGLETLVVDADGSILERNGHLENFPGFPLGVDARLFLEMTRDQAERAGCEFYDGAVVDLRRSAGGFRADVDPASGDGDTFAEAIAATQVIAASWSDASYLRGIQGVDLETRSSKTFVLTEDDGRTGVDGLYAAGRIADQYHQAVVAAGHGATAGISAVHDSPVDLYHDWVTPERYFTGRDRAVPPGCEEIDDDERQRREATAREYLREYLDAPPEDEPTMHPSVPDRD